MKRLVTLLAALAALQTYAQRIEATLPSPDAKSLGMGGVMMTTLSGSHAIYNNSATAIFSHTPSQVSSSYYGPSASSAATCTSNAPTSQPTRWPWI